MPTHTPKCTCPKCGTLLKYEEIKLGDPSFPCSSCGEKLRVPGNYVSAAFLGVIFVPALILWALGLSWLHLVVVELIVVYPILSLTGRFVMHVFPPKLEVDWPKGPGLHLRDR